MHLDSNKLSIVSVLIEFLIYVNIWRSDF